MGNKVFDFCPNCNEQKVFPVKGFEKKSLSLCKNCNFVYDFRIPTQEELEDFYSGYSYSGRKPCPRATKNSYERLLDAFEGFRKSGKLLDVGCGQGDFLLAARSRGWTVYGTEFSKSAVALCRDEGLNVSQGSLRDLSFNYTSFDVVTSFEVFEHIQNGKEEMGLVKNILRDGGLFYMTTPNFNSLLRFLEGENFPIVRYPEHISFYTPKSIGYLANSCGMRVLKIETTGLEPGRLKSALRLTRPSSNRQSRIADWRHETSAFREKLTYSWRHKALKAAANIFLNATGTGDALKAWLVKNSDSGTS